MIKKKIITVFDIGKTNKKILLFDEDMEIIRSHEKKIPVTYDEDGFECDDIEGIEAWIKSGLSEIIKSGEFDVKGINFSTYGASLVFLDKKGNRLTPLYNYLKPVPASIGSSLFKKYGGELNFCRKTASPAYGMLLNSGIQILWLKEKRPEVFNLVKWILHLPQYFSFLLTGEIHSEFTSVGCHTFMWDFERNNYHQWLKDAGIHLPEPISNSLTIPVRYNRENLVSGIGIHDSSASLLPCMMGSRDKFILISTGTWCISMNPYNHEPLTAEELKNDCLMYLSVDRLAVKSSRFFLGQLHDMNVKRIAGWFHIDEEQFKTIKPDLSLLKALFENNKKDKVFFRDGIPADFVDETADLTEFKNFTTAYHRFMYDLTLLNAGSIRHILSSGESIRHFYVTGGFAGNEIYLRLLAGFFPEKEIYTTDTENFSALGAALVIWHSMDTGQNPEIKLNLRRWTPVL